MHKQVFFKRAVSLFCALVMLFTLLPLPASAESTVWDGSVDISWYNDTDMVFHLTTPAQLAGLAAIVNGCVSYDCPNRAQVEANLTFKAVEDVELVGSGGGNIHDTVYYGTYNHDFKNKTIYLDCDMDMGGVYDADTGKWSGPNWMPIGSVACVCNPNAATTAEAHIFSSNFNGTLDGQGHRITNLYCERYTRLGLAYAQGAGLIGYIGELYDEDPATATDIPAETAAPAVRNLSVSGSIHGRRMVGGIVGRVGEISTGVCVENCANYAAVKAHDAKGVGGIVATGWGTGYIINCYNTGSISNPDYNCPAGGICGNNGGMDIYCCYNVGQISSALAGYARGIGGHDEGIYTVSDCYSLQGCDGDTASNGWYRGSGAACTIRVAVKDETFMKSEALVTALNCNGTAFVYQEGGYPKLLWEQGTPGSGTLTLAQPEEATVAATATDIPANGTVVYLAHTIKSGYAFRSYTLNGNDLSGDYVTVSGTTVVSCRYEEIAAGVLLLPESPLYTLSVKRTYNGITQSEENISLTAGSTISEDDVLEVTAAVKEGVEPSEANDAYSGRFDYIFTYQDGTDAEEYENVMSQSFTVKAGGAALEITAKPCTTQKMWSMYADTDWYNESDTEFTLTTARQLAGLMVLVNGGNTFAGKTVMLGCNLSLLGCTESGSGKPWWDGIGRGSAFKGTFDGCNHEITQLLAYSTGSGAGLFIICNGATVKNLIVSGTSSAGGTVGGVVATAAGGTVIENCRSYMDISIGGSFGQSGGIVGCLTGGSTVKSCINSGFVEAKTDPTGGIAGQVEDGSTVEDCVNYGKITCSNGSFGGVGGLVGQLGAGCSLLRSGNYGEVSAKSPYVGGLVGYCGSLGAAPLVRDCYNIGKIFGKSAGCHAGGLIGYTKIVKMEYCYNYGAVVADSSDTVGALIGYDSRNSNSAFANLYYLADTANYPANGSDTYTKLYHCTKKSAKDFAAAKFLSAINKDKCFVLENGMYPELSFIAASRYCRAHTDIDGDGLCDHCGAGDPNGDGAADILDYQYLYRYILSQPAQVTLSLDLTGDGQVTALDLQRFYEYISGQRSLFA